MMNKELRALDRLDEATWGVLFGEIPGQCLQCQCIDPIRETIGCAGCQWWEWHCPSPTRDDAAFGRAVVAAADKWTVEFGVNSEVIIGIVSAGRTYDTRRTIGYACSEGAMINFCRAVVAAGIKEGKK